VQFLLLWLAAGWEKIAKLFPNPVQRMWSLTSPIFDSTICLPLPEIHLVQIHWISWSSSPSPYSALIVVSSSLGRLAKNIWIFRACPSLIQTSTCMNKKLKISNLYLSSHKQTLINHVNTDNNNHQERWKDYSCVDCYLFEYEFLQNIFYYTECCVKYFW